MHSKYSKCWKMRGVSEGFCIQQDWRSTPVKDKIGSSNLALPSFSPKDGNYWVFYCCMTHVCCHFSQVQLFETLWTIACQAPLSMGFSRQEYWSGLPWPLPRDLSNPGMEPVPLCLLALTGGFFTSHATWENLYCCSKSNSEPGKHWERKEEERQLWNLPFFLFPFPLTHQAL